MQQIAQDHFVSRPETATYYSVPDEKAGAGTSSRLARFSAASEIERRAGLKAILDALAGIDKTQLTESQRISLGLVVTGVGNAYALAMIVDYGFVLGVYGVWINPYVTSHLTGPLVEIPALFEDKMAFQTSSDAMAYLSRLNNYAGALEGAIGKVVHDRALGVAN